MMQPLWKIAWSFLKKLKMQLPYDLVIPFLPIYPKRLKAGAARGTCTSVLTATLFTKDKRWKPPKCPSMDKWTKQNIVYIQ